MCMAPRNFILQKIIMEQAYVHVHRKHLSVLPKVYTLCHRQVSFLLRHTYDAASTENLVVVCNKHVSCFIELLYYTSCYG